MYYILNAIMMSREKLITLYKLFSHVFSVMGKILIAFDYGNVSTQTKIDVTKELFLPHMEI